MCEKGLFTKNVQTVNRYYLNLNSISKRLHRTNYNVTVRAVTRNTVKNGKNSENYLKKDNHNACRLFLIDFYMPGGI